MGESTLKDNKVFLLTCIRCIDKGEFAEEILFCKSVEIPPIANDV